jgi:putative CocE/NonD family hydrolase
VTGRIELALHVSSSAADTDFTAKLVDVYPDGRAYNLQEGVIRARYREGLDREVFLSPDRVVPVVIELEATSNFFGPGHRLRLEVSSSSFPRFERNLNTGGRNFDERAGVPARNRVHHSAAHPSHLVLPVIRRSGVGVGVGGPEPRPMVNQAE